MPEMDGFEVIEKLKQDKHSEQIPVIFLTARNQTEDLVRSFEAGGVDFINKPFIKEELLARVRTHVELYESRRKIIDMNRTRDKLYSVIAHDIRSPFSAIIQTLELLTENKEMSHEDSLVLLGMLYERSQRTYELLNNLLDWTRIKSGRICINKRNVRLDDAIVYNFLLLAQSATTKQIKMKSLVKEGLLVYVDEKSLNTIIRNLLTNAIKFTHHGGEIEIDASKEKDEVIIVVRDNGVGISDKNIATLLTENNYLSTYGTNNESGSGLGLFLVNDLVSLNSGKIRVESSPETGTCFYIIFPI
jgi:signal transduction histidine kinase